MKLSMSKKSKRCGAFSTVWAAIYKCEGDSKRWHYTFDGLGRRVPVYVCATCEQVRDAHAKLNSKQLQEVLAKAQVDAGVENYRYQSVAWENGRPVLKNDR